MRQTNTQVYHQILINKINKIGKHVADLSSDIKNKIKE